MPGWGWIVIGAMLPPGAEYGYLEPNGASLEAAHRDHRNVFSRLAPRACGPWRPLVNRRSDGNIAALRDELLPVSAQQPVAQQCSRMISG